MRLSGSAYTGKCNFYPNWSRIGSERASADPSVFGSKAATLSPAGGAVAHPCLWDRLPG